MSDFTVAVTQTDRLVVLAKIKTSVYRFVFTKQLQHKESICIRYNQFITAWHCTVLPLQK